MQNLSYPFWTFPNRSKICGGNDSFELICESHRYPIGKLPGLESIRLFYVNQSAKVMSWIHEDIWKHKLCPENFANDSIVKGSFTYEYDGAPAGSVFLRLYSGCDWNKLEVLNFSRFPCPIRGEEGSDAFYSIEVLGNACNFRGGGSWVPKEAISPSDNYGELEYPFCTMCEASHGICGTNESTNRFACLCRDGPREFSCEDHGSTSSIRNKLIIGVTCGVAITNFCVILLCLRKKLSWICSMINYKNATKSNQNVESFLRNQGALSLKRYKLSDVNRMTNSFTHQLGQGGYGIVYKGKLRHDCLVAVKVLNISNGNGEEFINEVASISRTSHINIVNLLGFCVEGRKRILIYEFMPNGSLDKFIGLKTVIAEQQLGWENLYQIALGVARGLEYLHHRCTTRILHLDIKPHNILLDEDLCPKISDFGLAKLVYKKESAVSLAEARGTLGYIAPEVFMKHLGRVSYKSDIYSYGMMVLEMVGARNEAPEEVENSTDKYFPNWIYTQLEASDMCATFGLMTTEEVEVVRKMTIVGLWCIQTNPSDRPSMSKVIEMLEGGIEALQIPEKPFTISPTRLPTDSFTSSMN